MRPIQLPEPPSPTGRRGTPEIFESGVHTFVRRAVVIGNGFPSSENQSIGLVRALGLSDKHLLYLLLKSQQKKLLPLSSENGFGSGLSAVLEADVWQIVNLARETYEKSAASENVFVVQIQHPRLHLNRFDMVITPKHDYYPLTPQGQKQVPRFLQSWITPRDPPDSHVVLTMGALNQIDFTSIRSAATMWHDEFAHVPRPVLVVNIGGPTRNCRYGIDLAKQLAAYLLSVLVSCGSVRISFSERTPEKVSNIIVKELGNNPKVHIWDGKESNLHMGHLAWADAFVVTADSVSMISEACSIGLSRLWEGSVADGSSQNSTKH